MKIYGFADYLKGTAAEQKAFREKVVKEVLAGGKRREIAKRFDIDARTLCFWVRLHAGENIKPTKVKKPKKRQGRPTKKKRRVVRMPAWKQKWQETKKEAVAAVWAGEKPGDVAERFGITRQALSHWVKAAEKEGHLRAHGLRHLTEVQRRRVRKEVVKTVKAGISQATTARRFGVSELSVGKWIKLFDEGGRSALDNIVQFQERIAKSEIEKPTEGKPEEKKEERFHLRFDIHERPVVVNKSSGKAIAENFIGQTVACHNEDHEVVSAYFDAERGIILSYVHVPVEEDPLL